MEKCTFHGYGLHKFEIIFRQSPIHYEDNFRTLACDALCGYRKIFAEVSEPFIRAVAALRRLQNGVLRVHPSGTKRWKLEGVKSGLQEG